ncbi:MAG: c-type cytochrome domain-containing protein, partial [Verrucomicrobiota bacterium]
MEHRRPTRPGTRRAGFAIAAWALWLRMMAAAAAAAGPDFTTEVRPILSQHCFKCHGPDDLSRKGGLRLDVRDAAVRPAKSG